MDAVALCTPSGQHAEQTVLAARAGKHVLVEKPMAVSLEDADAMIQACRDAGVVLQSRFLFPFLNLHEAILGGVPERRKAGAVRRALLEPVRSECPASALRSAPHARLLPDPESAAGLAATDGQVRG